MDTLQPIPMPKKSCVVSLMFAIIDDKEALDIKAVIDQAVQNIKDKRYTFQIIET